MFTRHDELRESEKALSCMAEYAMRCLKRKRVRVSSGVLTRFLKSERKLQVCFLKITTLSSSSSKITKSCNVPKFSQSSPVITILRRTIVASIVEIAMPAAKRVAKFHLAKNTRRDRADRVIAPLPSSSSEQPRKMLASVHIDSYRRGGG